MDDLTIAELEERSGVPRRTIYFYVQQGLLPPPRGAGLGARYGRRHRDRLAAIPLLRAAGWRLDRIRRYFADASEADVAAILAGHIPGDAAPVGGARETGHSADLLARRARSVARSRPPGPDAAPPAGLAEPAPADRAPSPRPPAPEAQAALVERYRLAPGVDLLVDRDIAAGARPRVAALLALARRLFAATPPSAAPATPASEPADPPAPSDPIAADPDSDRPDETGGP